MQNLYTVYSSLFGIILLIFIGNKSFSESIPGTENAYEQLNPVVNFSASLNLIPKGNSINFADLSTGSPISWIWSFQGGTPANHIGKIPPPVFYNSAGSFDVSLTVTYPDNLVITDTKSAFIQVRNFPAGWTITSTGTSHLINIPVSVTFTNSSLTYGDYIGVFYLDQGGVEKCGGATIWDGTKSRVVVAYGDDATTTTIKEGFSSGENFIWKIWKASYNETVNASVAYNASLPQTDGKFYDNGLSSLITVNFVFTAPLSATATANPGLVCAGNMVQLHVEASGGTGNYTYSWTSNPAGFTSQLQNPVAYPQQSTVYSVVVSDGISNITRTASVQVTPSPGVFAGSDVTICENQTVVLAATAANHCGLLWSTSGDGVFNNPALPGTTYSPGSNDIINGMVELCLTAQPCNPCTLPAVDCITIEIKRQATIDIIVEQATICYDDNFDFTGLVDAANYENLQWFTTGGGFFLPNNNVLEPVYYPSPVIDYPQGCIQISVTAFSVNPCELVVSDDITLCFQAPPMVNAGEDVTICEDETVVLMATAGDYCGILWQTNGLGFFDDPTSLTAIYYPSPIDVLSGTVQLCITALPCVPCAEPATDCITITIGKIHTITIPSGWSGISSFIEPFESDIEFIMSPVIQELIMMYNQEGEMLFPEDEINTIINWDRLSGYVIKMDNQVEISLCGLSDDPGTIQLTAGWNLVPVLCGESVSTAELFQPVLNQLEIVKEVAGVLLFYPAFNISTLETIQPGKAYFVKVSQDCSITCP